MNYESIHLREDLVITDIISIHYFEYMSTFYFPGESHDFWEFLCVDKGEVNVLADDTTHTLQRGDIIFHKPNEFHNVKANGKIAPNLVVIAFKCHSNSISFFKDKTLTISEHERNLLANIIIEGKNSFSSKLEDPYLNKLERKETPHFASEQLIKHYLEELLISFIRRNKTQTALVPSLPAKSVKQKSDQQIYARVTSYLMENIYSRLTIEQICRDNLVGRSQLQKIFQEKNNCGIIDYFLKQKIAAAKQLIRNNHMNFTQISDTLGYTSIHYFSRQFKKSTGMSPSEYASSIMVISEPSLKEDI